MKWVLRVILAVVIFVGVAVGGIALIPTDTIARLATERLSASLARDVTLTGAVRPSFYPMIGISAEGFEISNPDWAADQGPMLRAEALHIGVEVMPLFSGEVRIARAELIKPDIILLRNADGQANWEFSTTAPTAETGTSGDLPQISLSLAQISDGTLRYTDATTAQSYAAEAVNLRLEAPDLKGSLTGSFHAAINGARLRGDVTLTTLADALAGREARIDMSLSWTGGSLGYRGALMLAPFSLAGEVNADITDLTPITTAAGVAAVTLPAGLGRDRIALNGPIAITPEGVAQIMDATLALDDTAITLSADLSTGGERPKITGRIAGGRVDLSALTEGSATEGSSAGGGWPRDEIDLTGLFAVDANLDLALAELDLGMMRLSDIALQTTLDAGRLQLDLARAVAYGGTIAGQTVINGRGNGSVASNMAIRAVQLQPLLQDFADYDRLSGTGNVTFNILAGGRSVAAWMNSLEGSAALDFGQGAIEGLDLAGMIRNLDSSYRGEGARTVYDSITATLAITGGVARNDDLTLTAGWGGVTGTGEINIGGQSVEYRVIPAVQTSSDGSNIAVPVIVRGPWADLSFAPDLEYLANQRLELERAELEAAAQARIDEERARLEQEARDRLNLPAEGDARDAIENQLRNEVEGALRGLFGGN